MTHTVDPLLCPACQSPVSVGGGRCPNCGEFVPEQRSQAPLAGPMLVQRDERAKTSPTVWILGALVVAGAALLVFWQIQEQQASNTPGVASVPAVSAPTSVAPAASAAPQMIDPSELFAPAKSRALRWHQDALLVRIEAKPVQSGRVDPSSGGSVSFWFGAPLEKLGPGEPLTRDRYLVTTTDGQLDGKETRGRAGEAGIADPVCPLEEAYRKAVAAGIPSTAAVSMTYSFSAKHGRAVWRVQVLDDKKTRRTLDGNSCAILMER